MDAECKLTILLLIAINVCAASIQDDIRPSNNISEPLERTTTWNGDVLQWNLSDLDSGPNLALSAFNEHIDPEFLALINPFWLKFSPAPAPSHYSLAIVHSFIMIIGLIGNALFIFMFMCRRSIRTPCNILVLNLAISDFFMLAKAPIVIYNSFKLGPALGDSVCRLYGFIGGLMGTASIATLTAISIDRYNVVVYPLDPLRSTTRRRSYIMVIFVWCYSFIFSIVPALNIGLSKYVPEGYLTSCGFDYLDKTTGARIFMFVFFIFAWLIPFITITYCYTYILKAVISSRHIRSNKEKNKTEIKLSLIVIGVIVLWFVAWTPYAIVALLGISGNEDKITPFGSMIPAVFCKASACINPYIYSVTQPKFRSEFGRLCLGRNQNDTFKTSYYKYNRSTMQKSATIKCRKISLDPLTNESLKCENLNDVISNAAKVNQMQIESVHDKSVVINVANSWSEKK